MNNPQMQTKFGKIIQVLAKVSNLLGFFVQEFVLFYK